MALRHGETQLQAAEEEHRHHLSGEVTTSAYRELATLHMHIPANPYHSLANGTDTTPHRKLQHMTHGP